MRKRIAHRLAQALVSLLAISMLVFVAVYMVGEPAALYDPLVRTDPQRLAALRAQLGLDRPLYLQYLGFLSELLRGDFGTSWVYQEPAMQVVFRRLPATLELVALAMLLALALGFPLGLIAGLRSQRWPGALIVRLSILGYSTPTFWIGLVLIYVFAVNLDWLPALGRGDTVTLLGAEWSLLTADGLRHLWLPAVTLAFYEIGYFARMTATMTQETLPLTYIQFARAKGLTERQVIRHHLLKPVSIPLVTIAAIETGTLVAGSVITETVFGWPGVGKLLVDSVAALDRPVIVAFVMVTASLFLLLNLCADLLQAWLDPTLQEQGALQ